MARRRADGEPGLLDRVRWRNVGRLVVLLAAGLLIAAGPRGGRERARALPPAKPVAPTAPRTADRGPRTAGPKIERHRRTRAHRSIHRRRRRRRPRVARE